MKCYGITVSAVLVFARKLVFAALGFFFLAGFTPQSLRAQSFDRIDAFELAGTKIDPAKAGTLFPVEWKK